MNFQKMKSIKLKLKEKYFEILLETVVIYVFLRDDLAEKKRKKLKCIYLEGYLRKLQTYIV